MRVSFGSIAPLLALGVVVIMVAGIAVRLARAVRARMTRADDGR